MMEWLETTLPPGYANAVIWVALALALLVVLLVIIRLLRGITGGTFIAGGRARKARLAVMDAAPVDSRRRLVLVRRDDVEHLILIGGPTDVVVEQNIRAADRPVARPAQRPEQRPAPVGHDEPHPQPHPHAQEPARHAPPPRPVVPPAPATPRPQAAQVTLPRPTLPMAPPPQPPTRSTVPSQAAPATPRPASAYPAPNPGQHPAPTPRMPAAQDLDNELLGELRATLDARPTEPKGGAAAPRSSAALDQEMNRLLGELANKR